MAETWLWIISLAALMISAYTCITLVMARSRNADADEQLHNVAWLMERKLGKIGANSQSVDNRLKELESRIQVLEERVDSRELRDAETQPYQLAIQLARQGIDAQKLAHTCGLTEGEAELLHLMHKQIRRAPKAARSGNRRDNASRHRKAC